MKARVAKDPKKEKDKDKLSKKERLGHGIGKAGEELLKSSRKGPSGRAGAGLGKAASGGGKTAGPRHGSLKRKTRRKR